MSEHADEIAHGPHHDDEHAHAVRSVWFNDGEDESLFALVLDVDEDTRLWLSYAKNGAWQFTDVAVPRREIVDYASGGGGGMTYHLSK